MGERAEILTDCCRELFFEIAVTHPIMLTKAFTVVQFAAVLCCGASHHVDSPLSGEPLVSHFFSTLRHHPPDDCLLLDSWMLPLRAIIFVKFLSNADPADARLALECLLVAIRQATSNQGSLQAILCFTLHLCLDSPVMSRLMFELGVLDTLNAILAEYSRSTAPAQLWIPTGCTLVISALRAHIHEEALGELSLHHSFIQAVEGSLNATAEHYTSRYVQVQWLAMFQLGAHAVGRPLDSNPWKLLLSESIFSWVLHPHNLNTY